jgi:hypothetical protein
VKLIAFVLLSFLLSLSLSAQKRFDLFNITGNYNLEPGVFDFLGDNETALTSNLSIPLVLNDSSVWFNSIDYQYYSIGNTFTETAPIDQFKLHGLILRTGYIHRFNAKQSLQMLLVPRIMTDFNASLSSSLQWGGIVMYEKKKNADFTWRAGVLYNQEFFGTQVVPLLYLDWNVTRKLKVKGLFPIYGKVFLQSNERIAYGLHFVGLTTSYALDETLNENRYVERRAIDVSLFAKIQVWNNLFLESRAGKSVTKNYGLFAKGDKLDLALPLVNFGDDRTRLNETLGSTTPFFHLRFIYSIATD